MLKAFSMTDIGKIRKMNQDFVYACARPVGQLPNLFIAADGMGGHNAGDYASKCAVQTIVDKIAQDKSTEPVRIIKNAVETANSKVHQEAENSSSLAGMGTTVVVASCVDNTLVVANVGDSRLYVINEEIKQITRDHSLVEEMVRLGALRRRTPGIILTRISLPEQSVSAGR